MRNIFLFFIVFTASSHFEIKNAQAQSNIYLVDGIAAKAFEESSSKAKITATATARRDAFVTLLSRLSLDTTIADDVSDEELFDMVNSEQITRERISASSYYAIFNIKFSRNDVERILKTKNVRRHSSPDETFLLIPVKVLKHNYFETDAPNEMLLWEQDNDWKSVVQRRIENKSMFQFIVPDNDLSNITTINKDNIEHITYEDLEPLFSRYRSSEGLIMFFYYDDIENKVTISVKDIRKLQKKHIKLSFVNVDRLSYDSLIDKVAEKTLNYLLNVKNSDDSNTDKSFVKIEVPISSLGEWIMIKNKIENTNLVNQLNIESISKDYVRISINYISGDADIIKSFANKNIHLKRKSENLFSLSVSRY